ncbi:transcriptional repressor NrdR [Planctomycetales bacterium]|nr:transcriptional repressor NrdR [Planctomycetales bacterium]
MRCPYCKTDDDKVIDTRTGDEGLAIRRRRECLHCGRRYTTHERLEESPIKVTKKDGRVESFDRKKIVAGIARALRKRPLSSEEIENLSDSVEREIFEQNDRQVASSLIGETIMRHLHQVDPVAYVRFASVYREFSQVSEFIDEIRALAGADTAAKTV